MVDSLMTRQSNSPRQNSFFYTKYNEKSSIFDVSEPMTSPKQSMQKSPSFTSTVFSAQKTFDATSNRRTEISPRDQTHEELFGRTQDKQPSSRQQPLQISVSLSAIARKRKQLELYGTKRRPQNINTDHNSSKPVRATPMTPQQRMLGEYSSSDLFGNDTPKRQKDFTPTNHTSFKQTFFQATDSKSEVISKTAESLSPRQFAQKQLQSTVFGEKQQRPWKGWQQRPPIPKEKSKENSSNTSLKPKSCKKIAKKSVPHISRTSHLEDSNHTYIKSRDIWNGMVTDKLSANIKIKRKFP